MTMHDVYFARQSIFDSESNVAAYELYFRSNDRNQAEVVDDDAASSQVILTAMLELEPRRFLGSVPALINVPDGLLKSPLGLDQVLNPGKAVIQLLRGTSVDNETITLAQMFRAAGYRIAIDWFASGPPVESLLPLADIIKVQIDAAPIDDVLRVIAELKTPKRKIMATRIETNHQFVRCKEAGTDWFQGYYLRKPQLERRRRPTGSRLSVMRILAVVQDPAAEVDEIEKAIRSDVALSYRLLKVVNSAAYYLPIQISSIRHAVVMLGNRRVRQWATLALMAGIDNKPQELCDIAIIRAKMCESLGEVMGHPDPEAFFLVGLLSVLDSLTDQPMATILEELPIAENVAAAILSHEGELGAVLETVIAREECREAASLTGRVSSRQVQTAYLDAITWSVDVRNQMRR